MLLFIYLFHQTAQHCLLAPRLFTSPRELYAKARPSRGDLEIIRNIYYYMLKWSPLTQWTGIAAHEKLAHSPRRVDNE